METAGQTQNSLQQEIPAIAANELSARLVDGMTAVSGELAQTYPEYEGVTLYGSTVRGETHEGSDVDAVVFMKVSEDSPEQAVPSIFPPLLENAELRGTVQFNGNIVGEYKKTIEPALARHGIPAHSDVSVLPISEEIATDAAHTALAGAKEYDDTGVGEAVSPRNIRALFHPGIGDRNLAQYRSLVLREFSASPHGPTAWRMLRHILGSFEVGRGEQTADRFQDIRHRHVPQTLDDAVQYYGA